MTGAGDYLVGLDVGSTTVKAVVMKSHSDAIFWQDYQRHETRQPEKVLEFLKRMEAEIGIDRNNCRIFLTGSGAGNLAPLVGGKFVQEVLAVSLAVEKLHPETRSVIELGGQDAKVIIFKPDPGTGRKRKISSMNDKCAGGTGAVIDKMAAKLRIRPEQLARQGYNGIKLHAVAGKCGVFAETDINSLQKQGIPSSQLMASLFEAIVVQNLTVLTRGHTLHPHVLLLGGPNTFIPGMREAWQANIPKMWEERGVGAASDKCPEALIRTPDNAVYFAAVGSVEFGKEEDRDVGRYCGTEKLAHYIEVGRVEEKLRSGTRGLSRSADELAAFRARYRRQPFAPATFERGDNVGAFVGIDGGSTSTKAVLMSERGDVLSKAYQLSKGNPIQDTVEVFETLRSHVEGQGAHLDVLGVGTTGYAKDLLKDVIKADVAVVETVAHAQSAVKYYGEPDVIVDVGGQDIKLILLKDGRVRDFMLNTQCSAGNGYFLQSTAQDFGVTVDDYADLALAAEVMPVFSYGCAVFLQSDIVNFQRKGWRKEEILAALATVLPKNIWLYVAKIPNLSKLGRRFILQGGTQNNLAAVKAQVDYIRSRFREAEEEPEILVHEHCGEAGAIGAAVEAARLWGRGRKTTFIGADNLRGVTYRTTHNEDTRCWFCQNRCLRTFIDVRMGGADACGIPSCESKVPLEPGEQRLIISTCEKGSVEDVESMRGIKAGLEAVKKANPNLAEIAAREAWRSKNPPRVADPVPGGALTNLSRAGLARNASVKKRGELRVGIPRLLALYQYAPFFTAYLESLGVAAENLVFSDYTSESLYREGARRGAIDPCFPSKVAISHIHNLIYVKHRRTPLDCIFFPMLDVLTSHLHKTLAQNACPMVAITPEVVKAAFTKESDVFEENGMRYLAPLVHLSDHKLLSRQMFQAWESILGLSEEENERAIQAGFDALDAFQSDLRTRSREVIDSLEREDRLGIVILGRSYHHDPGINQGIFEELQKLGYPILTQSTLPLDEDLLDRLFGEEVRAGVISSPLDVSDAWKNTASAASALKIWAAKFAARHPNLVAVEISSFKCGHDAPIYPVIEGVVECAGTPFFSFRDVDENKPTGSIKVRVETIHYFLSRHREEMRAKRTELEKRLAHYQRQLQRA
jgi:predicted CoA-substrate-specific enzyme activase